MQSPKPWSYRFLIWLLCFSTLNVSAAPTENFTKSHRIETSRVQSVTPTPASQVGESANSAYLPLVSDGKKATPTPTSSAGHQTPAQLYLPVIAKQGGATPQPTPTGAPSDKVGWISGILYNSATCTQHLTRCQGLAGARITMAKVDTAALAQARAARRQQLIASNYRTSLPPSKDLNVTTPVDGVIVTEADGSFHFPLTTGGAYWLRAEKDGYTYAQREVEVVVGRSTATNAIYLTPLDPAVTACTTAGCTHNNSDGSIQLQIPAGAIPQGDTVNVTATNFKQVEFLPSGDLPEGTWETYAFNLGGDSEYVFQPGAQAIVRMKNAKGFAPGTKVPLGYWNQATQAWEHAGTGIVDAAGEWLEMGVTHFSNYDCNDPLDTDEPEEDTDNDGGDGGGDGSEEDEPCNGEEGCFISRKSGSVQEWIELSTVNVLGEQVAPQLRYSTDRAAPSEVIDLRLGLKKTNTAQIGNYIGFEMYIEGERTDQYTFAADLNQLLEFGRYRYYWDGRNARGELLPPGAYRYKARFSIPYRSQYCDALNGIFGNPPDCVNGATGVFVDATKDVWVSGTVTLDRIPNNPLGMGWILNNQQRLYTSDNGDILISDGQRQDEFEASGKLLGLSESVTETVGLVGWKTDSSTLQVVRQDLLEKNLHPLPMRVGRQPASIVLSADNSMAYVVNEQDNTLSILDLNSRQQIATVPVGSQPADIALAQDGNIAYITNAQGNSVSVIDISTRQTLDTIPVGNSPRKIRLAQNGLLGYVTNFDSNSISVIDLGSRQQLTTIQVGNGPGALALSRDGQFAYVINDQDSTLSVIDLQSQQQTRTITLSQNIGGTSAIALSSNGQFAYVAESYRGNVLVIDLGNNDQIGYIDSCDTSANHVAVVLSPDERFAYVTCRAQVAILDLSSRQFVDTIQISSAPSAIALSADGRTAYLTNFTDSTVSSIALNKRLPIITRDAGDSYYSFNGDIALSINKQSIYITSDSCDCEDEGARLIALDLSRTGTTSIKVDDDPRRIALSKDGRFAYLTHEYADAISVVDLRARQQVSTIPVRANVVAVSDDNSFIYAIDYNSFLIIDASSRQLVGNIRIGDPTAFVISLDERFAYVTNGFRNAVAVIDLNSRTKIADIPVGASPGPIARSSSGHFLYVANLADRTVSVIEVNSQQQMTTIPVDGVATAIALSEDDRFAYLPLEERNLIAVLDLDQKQMIGVFYTLDGDVDSLTVSLPFTPTIESRTETDHSILTYDVKSATYTRTYPDGTRVHFHPNGAHDYTLEPDGRKTIYTYNADGSLATMGMIPPGGQAVQWSWRFNYTNGKLSSVTDPANRVTSFTIDAQGDLVTATTPDNATQRFSYDSRHLLTQHTDQNGDVTDYAYDSYGRIVTVTEPVRAVYNPATGVTENKRTIRTFTPSDTGYSLVNDSPIGDPDQPAPAAPKSAALVDRVVYGRGQRSGHTNTWGSWLDETDGIGRTTYYQRDRANNITRQSYPTGECVASTYDDNGNVLSETAMSAAVCANGVTAAAIQAGEVQSRTYTYEARFNQIKTETDPKGNTTTYIYDYEEGVGEAGHLIRIEYPRVKDETGALVTPKVFYTYNAFGLLESETDLRSTVTKYIYTQGASDEAFGGANARFAQGVTPVPGLLTQVIADFGDASHLNLTITYKDFDAMGNARTVIDPQGNTTRYTFDLLGRKITATDALGRVTKFEYEGRGNLIEKIEDYTVDSATGRNIVTAYSYDEDDRLLTERTIADELTREINYTYDINGQVATQTDANGNTTIYHYDAADQRIAQTDGVGATTTYSYTLRGQLATITEPDGTVTRFVYDAFERQVQQIAADGDLNLTTAYAYDGNNNLVQTTAPDGLITCYGYDSHNRRASETRDCTGLKLTTVYTYNVAGDLIATSNERGILTLHSYDKVGRLLSTHQDATGLNLTTTYDYDANGNLLSSTDQHRVVTAFTYDVLNRRTSMTADANGLKLTTLYGYDRLNHQNSVTDPNGIVTLIEYNAFGLPVRQVQDANGLSAEIRYTYDNNLNLLTITDDNGNTTRYQYNKRNERTQTRFADDTTVTLVYHPDGTLASRTDQAGDTVSFTYDKANRLIKKSYPDGSTQSFTYDASGRPTSAAQAMSGHTTNNTFVYNVLGDVTQSTQQVDSLSWQVGYSYDYRAGTTTTHYPSGTAVTHQVDAVNRLRQVTQDTATVATYNYNDANGSMTLTHANGVASQIETDALYRVTRINTGKANQPPLADYRYGYDKAGNRIYMQRAHRVGQPTDVYQYDGLYQLTKVWYGANATVPNVITAQDSLQSYQLDSLGNRLALQNNGVAQTYLPNNGQRLTNPMNRYEAVDGKAFSYDAKGNTLTDGRNTYTYDYENRQIGMSGAGGNATYLYNALGHQVAKVVNGTTIYFVYNHRYQTLEERNGANTLAARYVYGGYIDEVLTMERAGQTYTYDHDAQFSVTEITNAQGELTERYHYYVYGKPLIFDGTGNQQSFTLIDNPVLFTGQWFDSVSGNYSFRARIYTPIVGRFLQMDHKQYVDGMNLYAAYFVLNGIDPYGTDFIAVGSRSVGASLGIFDHMSIEYYDQNQEEQCKEDGENRDSKAIKEGHKFTTRSIPKRAFRTASFELLPDSNTFGHWQTETTEIDGVIWTSKFWASDWISVIHRSSTAKRMTVIYADSKRANDAQAKWQTISVAATTYPYAEQMPLADILNNWPNSEYQFPPGNNSNTFARVLAWSIQRNADVVNGIHLGADFPRPVPDPGYTPTRRN